MKNFYFNKTHVTSFLVTIALVLMMSPIVAFAQAESGVTGIVSDEAGAVVPGASVVLTDTKTSREYKTTSNGSGVYNFPRVQPGEGYKLTFSANGFKTYVINNVKLGISSIETQNAKLSPGAVAAVVEVTSGDDATLNTSNASIGNVIGQTQLNELPIQIRGNPASLLSLQPGVVGNNVGTGATNRVGSVTGSRADQGNVTVDGIDSNDQATGQAFFTVGNIPIDSIQELRTVTGNPGASQGRSSGGQIDLATKSGSNQFHGSARIYYRTDKTAANEYFNNANGIERPALQRRQFGGSIGGPLPFFNFGQGGPIFTDGKDKTFFFFDYEGRRDDSATTASRTVPLASFRAGNLGYINNNAGCTSTSRANTTPTCISYLSPAQQAALDPAGVGRNAALLNFINSRYPLPNDLTFGDGINTGLFRFNAPITRDENTYTGRVDANLNDNHKVFSRLTITRRDSTNAIALFPGDADAVRFNDKSYQIVGGHSWIISPTVFNNFTVGVSASQLAFPTQSSAAFPTSYTFSTITSPFPSLSFQDRDVYTPTIRDDVNWTIGNHNIQFGASIKPIRQKSTLINDFNFSTVGLGGGLANFDSAPGVRPANLLPGVTSEGLYDSSFAFILGRLANLNTNFTYDNNLNPQAPGTGRATAYAYNEYEFYAQDNWRIRNDLTVNLGLRYHYYPAPYEQNGLQSGNDVDFDELFSTRVANGAAGIAGNNSEPFLSYDLIGKANNARPLYNTDKNNIAPRLGFAYNPSFSGGILGAVFGDRKTVIRGGGSVTYDRVGGAITFIQNQLSYLFDNSASSTFGNALDPIGSLMNDPRFSGIGSLPVANTAPTITTPFTPYINAAGRGIGSTQNQFNYAVDQNFEIPYSYQYSLGFQRELPGNFILDVSYVGRKGRKLLTQADAAQVVDFVDPASGQSMLDAFNLLQGQIQAGGAITPQPWIENQVLLGIQTLRGANLTCANFGQPNCTSLVSAFFGGLAEVGGTADLVQQLYLNRILRPNVGLSSQFAVNAYISNFGYSNYDGMLLSLKKRFSQGFQFDFNYTWSHAIDNESNVTNTVTGGIVYDLLTPEAGRGDADFDIRHLMNANGVWRLPFGRGRAIGTNMNKFVDAVVGGWTVSGIFTARSGLPLTSVANSYPVGFFTNSPAINTVAGGFAANVGDDAAGNVQYFADPTAAEASLRFPKHGESGNRNTFRSPSFWNVDMALSKSFGMPWSEKHRLTFRAEAYNLTNSVSFSVPVLTINSSNFGRITDTLSNAREMQFALRYDF